MARLGRASAIRSARLDALHDLRDINTRLNSLQCNVAAEIAAARLCLDRLEALESLEMS